MTIKQKRMHNFKDLTGRLFGDLTVLSLDSIVEIAYPYQTKKRSKWSCQCICGNIVSKLSNDLVTGRVKSCGCRKPKAMIKFNKENKSKRYFSYFKNILRQYKKAAEDRGFSWELTEEQFRFLSMEPCYYCGELPKRRKINSIKNKRKYKPSLEKMAGVDRKNSSLGYFFDNCVPCCKTCNRMKMNMNDKDFISQVIKIHNNLRKP